MAADVQPQSRLPTNVRSSILNMLLKSMAGFKAASAVTNAASIASNRTSTCQIGILLRITYAPAPMVPNATDGASSAFGPALEESTLKAAVESMSALVEKKSSVWWKRTSLDKAGNRPLKARYLQEVVTQNARGLKSFRR
jgi:hypothetical protein